MSKNRKNKSPNRTTRRPAVRKVELQLTPDQTLAIATEPVPLAEIHIELLLALDRMLTTGTYYPPGHAQYTAVANQCATAVDAALQDRTTLTIEVTPDGLVIEDGLALKDDRCAKRVYELLEPLNQALLEIHTGVTTEDLHEALTTLKVYHKQLTGTRNYQEIEVEGMPVTVAVTGRELYVRTKKGNGPEKTDSPINENFDPNLIPDAALVPTPEGQMMEREFLAVVRGLMLSGDPTHLQALMSAEDVEASQIIGTWVPDYAIKTIKEILDALEATHSDPMMLQHLINHAHTALELTGDPGLVELVFEKLRKENQAKPKQQKLLENRPKPKKKPMRFTMSRAELRRLIDEVSDLAETRPWGEDIIAPANADCMGICIQILHVAPTDELANGIASTMRLILTSPQLSDQDLTVAVNALTAVFKGNDAETTELVVTMICTPLRHAHMHKLGPLWLDVWHSLPSYKERERAWPHVVNELLMGMTWADPRKKLALYQELSKLAVTDRVDLLVRLESLQALQEKIMAKDLFHAPAPLLYGVHQLLMNSSMADQHGPLMHQRLAYQKAHSLGTLLVNVFNDYNHAHRKAYQAILSQGTEDKIQPRLREIAVRHLTATLTRLPEERREEPWVAKAISWLGRLGGGKARTLLTKIRDEKKYMVLPVWPSGCREAARAALAGNGRDERSRLGDDKS